MDRMELAKQFIQYSHEFRKKTFQKEFDEIMRGEIFVIFYVLYKKDGVFAKQIKDKMEVSSARVAAILNSLEKKELILRQQDSNDKRMIKVYLTDKGIKLAKQTQEDVLSRVLSLIDYLGDDAGHLIRIMGKLSGRLDEEVCHDKIIK